MIRIKEVRKQKKITAKELADAVNVAESTMSLYENGKREPDFDTLLKISKYLDTSIDRLLYNDFKEEPTAETAASVGTRIYEERKRLKLSQEYVAEFLHTTKQAVYKYENGIVKNIPTEKIEKLAQLFGVTPQYLIGWKEKPADEGELEDKNISNKTANRIKQLRIANGLTQQGLAKKLFKSDSTVRMWELGKSEPDIETLEKLSIIYGVSVDYLIGNSEIKKPAGEGELSNVEKEMLKIFRLFPDEQQRAFLEMGRSFASNPKKD